MSTGPAPMKPPDRGPTLVPTGKARQYAPTRPLRLEDVAGRVGLLVAWAIVIAIFGVLTPATFLTGETFAIIFGSQAVLVILALAELIPLTAGDYDLSVGSVVSLAAMSVAILNALNHWPIWNAVLAALVLAVIVGMVNGFITVVFGIDSFIVTLGVGTVVSGIVLWISNSATVSGVSFDLVNAVVATRVFGIPIEFYYALIVCTVIWYVFRYTVVGKRLLFVGRGRRVARLSGISVGRMRFGAFVAAGLLSGLAGVLYVGTSSAADPNSGAALLLPAFAAGFLGATSIVPGRFNPWGTMVAVYFLATGITGLSLLGISTFVQNLFYGTALIVAVVLSQIARRRREVETDES